MIEVLKLNQTSVDENRLSYVNSWFDKPIIKNQKKLMHYLKRFSWAEKIDENYLKNKTEVNYNIFIKNASSGLSLLISKQKGICQSAKIVRKFRKMIALFGEQQAYVSLLHVIDNYFKKTHENDVANKRQLAIHYVNQEIKKLYEPYKQLILTTFENQPDLKQKVEEVFSRDEILDNKVFSPSTNIKLLFKFTNLSFRSKKIAELEFNKIYFNSLFANSYFVHLEYIAQNLINSIPTS